jgi:hypothetical protein
MIPAISIEGLLKALTMAGAASEAVASLVELVTPTLGAKDQATLKEALADAQAENDEGHARLQAKLALAAKR